MGRFTKRFTEEQERAILSIFFTDPFGKVAFIIPNRDFGPEEQAALAAKYSRSDKPYQAKFLELLEKDETLDVDFIDALARDPSQIARFSIGGKSLQRDTARFHAQWSLGFTPEEKDEAIRHFGDDSIKDGANLLYHVNGVLDNDNKTITQDPRTRPQVVSTRYIDRRKVLDAVEKNPDIKAAKFGEEILRVVSMLGGAYERFTDVCAKFVAENPLNLEFRERVWLHPDAISTEVRKWREKELRKDPERTFSDAELDKERRKAYEKREKDYLGYARKTVFDFTRYLLTPSIETSMAVACDARTLEDNITALLSSPMQTQRDLGEALLIEGRKVMPTLLGEKTHAGRSEFIVALRDELREFARTRVEAEKTKSYEQTSRTNYVDDLPSFTDVHLAACAVYPHSHYSFRQLSEHFTRNPSDVKAVVDTILRLRGRFDQDPAELLHGGLMRETLMDYGGDRDVQRHRRGFKTKQGLSTYHGWEMPELFPLAGLDKEFAKLMEEADRTYRMIADDNPDVAQLMVPFAFKLRRLYSWAFGQDLFFAKLRSGEGGHMSYRTIAWDIEDADRERMPEFGRLFRVNRTTYPPELINLQDAKNWYNKEQRQK